MATWMVRAGRKAAYLERFLDNDIAAIGWVDLKGVRPGESLEDLRDRMARVWPDYSVGQLGMSASQVYKFANVITAGDTIITYDPSRRVYHMGKVSGAYRYEEGHEEDGGGNVRNVAWDREVPRDDLKPRTRNSLGAVSTLFEVPEHAVEDMNRVLRGDSLPETSEPDDANEDAGDGPDLTLDAVESRAADLIADRLSRLNWEEMQDLVAGVLRGMGYKTEVSPKGADRGKDIIASPDGFGFQDPRIIVEVKHRVGSTMGASEIRAFLGGRREGDKCLYVSTGGFTREARYEAERARFPVKLMTLEDLTDIILADYESLDTPTRDLIPLTRIYWPT